MLTSGLSLSATFASSRAHAEPADAPAQVTADDVTLDGHSQTLTLRGHVDVEADPFHLTSDLLHVTRSAHGLVVEGSGRVAFCPCLGEPVALVFRGATVAPPGDLFLTQPRLEVASVPVFWLPYFWLRSASRPGLLPPEVAYRGSDGVFLGDGVHMPWKAGDLQSGLEVRAGAYLNGGAAVEATLRTPTSVTTVRWDDLHQSGLALDARGSTTTSTPDRTAPASEAVLAWDADLLRGPRAVASTTDVEAASRVYDRAAAEIAWRPQEAGWVLASGVWGENVRGSGLGEVDAAGPVVRARDSGALGGVGAYDATLEGGALQGAGLSTMSYGRADAGALLASHLGPVAASVSARGATDLVDQGQEQGRDSAAVTRLRLALPLARSFVSANDPDDPWRHRVEPEVEAGALVARSDALLGEVPTPGGMTGAAWLADGGVKSALGQWGERRGLALGGDAGGVGGTQQGSAAVARWRAAASLPWLGFGAEGADVAGAAGWGHVVTARVRVGSTRSPSLALLVAGRAGVDPVLARALTDAPLASSSGFLATPGWTGGARATLPITALVTLRGGLDADLTAERLVAGRGSLEVHDRCQCVAVRLSAAERLGRDGVDVWLSVDLAPGH